MLEEVQKTKGGRMKEGTITPEQILKMMEQHAKEHQEETGCTNAEREQFLKNLSEEFSKRMFPNENID